MQQREVDRLVIAPRLRDQLRRQGIGSQGARKRLDELQPVRRDGGVRRIQTRRFFQRRERIRRRIEPRRLEARAFAPQGDRQSRIGGGDPTGDLRKRAHGDVGRRIGARSVSSSISTVASGSAASPRASSAIEDVEPARRAVGCCRKARASSTASAARRAPSDRRASPPSATATAAGSCRRAPAISNASSAPA